MENWKKFINEEADPAQVDKSRFPTKLSQVNTKLARKYTRSGVAAQDKDADDDVITVTPTGDKGVPVVNLKPSQSSMNIGKAMQFVVQMLHPQGKLKAGGDLGAFISKDNYIMDGHHRWIATGMIDPSLGVGGYKVGFPAPELIAILNAITKGRLGIKVGKKASGGFGQFTQDNILKQLMSMAKQGHPWKDKESGAPSLSPEQVMEALEAYSGQEGEAAITATAQKLATNLGQLTLVAPGFAPERPDMPVIDKDQVAGALGIAVNALQKGEVDVNPPYGAGGGQEHGETKGTGQQMEPEDWKASAERERAAATERGTLKPGTLKKAAE